MDNECLIDRQRSFFNNGKTRNISRRIESLSILYNTIVKYRKEIGDALRTDLGKSEFESYISETGFVLQEIRHTLKHLKKWAKPQKVKTPLILFGSKSEIQYIPYGVVLILSPWNYPFQLSMTPLVGAIAAGNTVILKPSPDSPRTNIILKRIISECFSPDYVDCIEADKRETDLLLKNRFDYIFYTGGPSFGKKVAEAASANLTPVTLELGGKSPCIVDWDVDIEVAARRIVWGKFLNCGQTCVAPDYIWVHRNVKEKLIDCLISEIKRQYGENPLSNSDYPHIVNIQRFYHLLLLLKQGKIEWGGNYVEDKLYIAPTILSEISTQSRVMDEEIFGPILPVLEYNNINDCIEFIQNGEKPLALYVFTRNKKTADKVLSETSSGGACINDVISHLVNTNLPFGGIGNSGMGSYHGIHSFRLFSHARGVVSTSTKINPGIKFAPYAQKLKWLKMLMK
ncbi:aldehyde dehydrogenase [Coprobacter tertius]|uniref:Aldehyde dehydrogenase n=1 Tax=Coprobacter tertius TaxID=2944915 RepID=A0ABT1ML92_9BACT|nr:aldehyde dehydrogenase [Coprobacter tertius]MCP9612036.1 aldehyde dehydrogenase [Coprobacter tertius]